MKRKELVKLIIDSVAEIQEKSGRAMPDSIHETTVPIGGLPGFDSLNGLELTIILSEEVGWPGKNLCVSDDGRKALSIKEMVDRLLQIENSSN